MSSRDRVLARYREWRLKKASVVRQSAWKSLPKGWTQESLKSFWESLTGKAEHKVTACINKMKDSEGVDDPGAFCASLADRMEPGWRSR